MKRLAALAAITLAACGQPAPQREPATGARLALTCEAFADASGDSLAAAHGAANVVEQTLPGVEGESYTATVLYPNDPARRLEIVWRDAAARRGAASVIVAGERSLWVGPHDLSIGDALAEIEAANGRPFQLWGFGWDYGGWVSDWQGGAFAPADGCNVRARFRARSNSNTRAVGEAAFMSNDASVRAADATVSQFGLMYQTAQ
jgi:hypothetical protein